MKTILLLLFLMMTHLSNAVNLKWNPNPETNIAGYELQWGIIPGHHPFSAATSETHITIPDAELILGTKYYFVVVAKNTEGQTSEPSDEVDWICTGTITPPVVPTTIKLLEIQSSEDLVKWKTFIYLPVDPATPTSLFIRARITEINPR